MSILSSIKSVASGIVSGAKNALQGDFSNLAARTTNTKNQAEAFAFNLKSGGPAAAISGLGTTDVKNSGLIPTSSLSDALAKSQQQKTANSALTDAKGGKSTTVRSSTSSSKSKGQKTPPPPAKTASSGFYAGSNPFQSASVAPSGFGAKLGAFFGGSTAAAAGTAPSGTGGFYGGGIGTGSSLGTAPASGVSKEDESVKEKTSVTKSTPTPLSAILAGIPGITGIDATNAFLSGGRIMPTPKVPKNIGSDVLSITPADVLSRREEVASNAGNFSTQQAQLQYAQSLLDQYKAKQDQIEPVPEAPVEETPEQLAFLEGFEPTQKINVQQELDAYREEIGLTEVTANRLDIMKQLNATNEAYQQIFDDIKKNPELPKALAQRRLNEAYEQQKQLVLQLSGQYDLLLEQENILNDQLNMRYNILKDEQAEERRKEDRLYSILNFMVEGGSIASLSDSELKKISDRLGVPLKSLQDTKTQVLKERKDGDSKTTIYSTDQGLVAVTQDNSGKVLGTNVVLPKTGGDGSTTVSSSAPAFETFLTDLQKQMSLSSGFNVPINEQFIANARTAYNKKYTTSGTSFSASEKKKLEAAGLLDADRYTQIQYLYGDGVGESDDPLNPSNY